jgi:hypothetical protein
MHARPYTAVLIESKTFATRVLNLAAPLQALDAQRVVENSYPDCKLLALVPGHHAVNSHSYELAESLRAPTNRFVDPYDNSILS